MLTPSPSQALDLARFLPPALRGPSALSELTNEQRAKLFDWTETQPAQTGGPAINLLNWPGWSNSESVTADVAEADVPEEDLVAA